MDNRKVVGLNDKRIPIIGQQPEVDINAWCVLVSYGSRRLVKPKMDEINCTMKDHVLHCIENGTVVECEHALDFLSPMRPMQPEPGKVAYTRDPVVSMLDFTLDPVKFYSLPTEVYFCEDMQEVDKTTYKTFVAASLAQAQAYRLARSPLNPNT